MLAIRKGADIVTVEGGKEVKEFPSRPCRHRRSAPLDSAVQNGAGGAATTHGGMEVGSLGESGEEEVLVLVLVLCPFVPSVG